MSGIMYLGNQMVSPVITLGAEENPLFPIKDGVITKDVSNGINAVGVKEVDDFGLFGAFSYIEYDSEDSPFGYLVKGEVSFPDLERVGHCGMKETFWGQGQIEKLNLPKLKVIEKSGLDRAFLGDYNYGSSALEVNMDSLENVGDYGLYKAFAYHPVSYLILPSLKAENFTNENDCQLYGMLENVSNCTVYLPSSTEQAIGSWSVVASGFGGTNTTTVFYIPTKIRVNVVQETAILSAVDKIFNGVIFGVGPNVHYIVNDTQENVFYLGTETDCTEGGASRTVNVDLTDYTYNKITLNIDESDSSKISASWNNIAIPLTQESSNVYSFYVNSSIGEQINISVSASGTHASTSATVTTNGQDIEETIVLPEYEDFVRPNLSSNGTPGGEFFAVKHIYDDSDTEVYKAFDGNDSTYWGLSGNYMYLGFYNPQPIMVSRIVLKCTNSSYVPTRIIAMFDGNDDFWGTQISATYSINGNEMTIVPQTTEFYKYQIILGVINSEARIAEVEIYGKVTE